MRQVQSLYLFNPTQLSPIHEPDSESVVSCGSVSVRLKGESDVDVENVELDEECDRLQDLEDCDQLFQQHQFSNGTKFARRRFEKNDLGSSHGSHGSEINPFSVHLWFREIVFSCFLPIHDIFFVLKRKKLIFGQF